DESGYARMAAAQIGTRHVERTLRENDLLANLDAALDSLDEPMADPSIVPTYLLSKLAAEHVKVALGGDGGDELWGGYPTYAAHRYARGYRRLPRFVRAALVKPLVRCLPVRHGYQSFEWKAKRFALRWDEDPLRRHLRWMSNTDLPDLQRILPDAPPPAQLAAHDAQGDGLNDVLALDFQTYLPGSVLAKVDRASMAHSLEVRPPLLANDLVAFAFSLPSHVKLGRGRLKALLKSAAAGLIPEEIIHRRKKGFAIPLARWVNGPLENRLDQALAGGRVWDSGLLVKSTFEQWRHEHRSRRAD